MIEVLSVAFGVSGAEDEVRDIVENEMSKLCDKTETDSMGNLICYKKGTQGYSKRIMLTAHMDEVGFIVTSVTKEGYLRFKTVGGIDPRVLIAKRVLIGKNKLSGVIGDKPPHLSDGEKDTVPTVRELFIDIGAKSEEEALKHVSPGYYACFESDFVKYGNGLIKGKALDDRIGCDVLMKLARNDYPYDIYYVFTVQEEIGCRGASTAAYAVRPDIAVIVEGTTCSDVPGTDSAGFSTKLRGGAALSVMERSSYSDIGLRSMLYNTAVNNSLKVQYKQTTFGGNDAGAIQLSETGVRTAVISVPCRYIHSPSCVACIDDINSCTGILNAFLSDKNLIREGDGKWSF